MEVDYGIMIGGSEFTAGLPAGIIPTFHRELAPPLPVLLRRSDACPPDLSLVTACLSGRHRKPFLLTLSTPPRSSRRCPSSGPYHISEWENAIQFATPRLPRAAFPSKIVPPLISPLIKPAFNDDGHRCSPHFRGPSLLH